MPLKFFGRSSGSGFDDEHTSAYFYTVSNEMVIIDCPISAFQKLKRADLSRGTNFYILITHTHADHIGGLSLLIQHISFVTKKKITVVAPSATVLEDIKTYLIIQGIELSWFKIVTVADIKQKEWFCDCIPTTHAPQLANKCFGYKLYANDKNIVYTGDTSTLVPFLPYLEKDTILYVDVSVHYGVTHLKLEDTINIFLSLNKKGIKVYLMHLDDIATAKKMVLEYYPNIEIVPLN